MVQALVDIKGPVETHGPLTFSGADISVPSSALLFLEPSGATVVSDSSGWTH